MGFKEVQIGQKYGIVSQIPKLPFSAYKSAISCDSFFLLEDKKISGFQTTIGIISENFLKKMGFDRRKLLENENKNFLRER